MAVLEAVLIIFLVFLAFGLGCTVFRKRTNRFPRYPKPSPWRDY